jgi:multiple sugar transport system permease protein
VNKTLSAVMLMYQQGFKWWRMGYAAAIAFALFLIILAGTAVQMRLQRERE